MFVHCWFDGFYYLFIFITYLLIRITLKDHHKNSWTGLNVFIDTLKL